MTNLINQARINFIGLIKNLKWWGENEMTYPIPFGIIDYTPVAKIKNIKDNHNKIIIVHILNKYNNIEKKKYKYSEPLAFLLEERGIPLFDKTKKVQRFEVVLKRDIGEIVYTK